MYGMEVGRTTHVRINRMGVRAMATTGELRSIIEDLELVDIGDAASYLGEDATVEEESHSSEQSALNSMSFMVCLMIDEDTLVQK
jgi:hypothetical protein